MPLQPRFLAAAAALAAVPPLAHSASAQNTAPHWSSFFGSASRDHAVAVARGPGDTVVIAGHTSSAVGLGTAGAFQTQSAGGTTDAFVAMLDPSASCGNELVWCTYFGGSGLELVFDLEVDASGTVTVVGLSDSPTLPAATGQTAPTNSGRTDGFVAQFGPGGAVLLSSMFLGGVSDDRICEVEVDGSGIVTVAGVTEAAGSLPSAANSYKGGLTDAFVARIDPSRPSGARVLWSSYIGGDGSDGADYGGWPGYTVAWEGNLDRMGLALDAAGNPAVVTVSVVNQRFATTTSGAHQPGHADAGFPGFSDAYLAVFDPSRPSGSQLVHATFLGGRGSDRPSCLVAHPDGGFVVGGYTFSQAFPTTTGCLQPAKAQAPQPFVGINVDGFVSHVHVDPGVPGATSLRYSTYLGGNAGEDEVFALAVDTAGVVTVAGASTGGNVPLTPRSHQDSVLRGSFSGMVARLRMAGGGSQDLLYGTLCGGAVLAGGMLPGATNFTSVALDGQGDAVVAGYTSDANFPSVPCGGGSFGGRDAAVLHLPLLPGPVSRGGLGCAAPACGEPLRVGVGGAPLPGSIFSIDAGGAPPSSFGVLVLGTPGPCLPLLGAGFLIGNPLATAVVSSDRHGAAVASIGVPGGFSSSAPLGLAAQWVFLTNVACPGVGPLSSSARLDF